MNRQCSQPDEVLRATQTHRNVWVMLVPCLLLFVFALPVSAQRNEVLNNQIASLQVVAGDDWLSPPIIKLNGDEQLVISFDDLSHEYRRYTYAIEHCEADWTPSEGVYPSDCLEGFVEGLTIDDYQESVNTNQLYTHYELRLPNASCKFKMSGNYRLTVMDDNDSQRPVCTVCFMVNENTMAIGIEASSNTDIDVNRTHQQVAMTVNYGSLYVTDPQRQIKTVVMQNGRWDNAVFNAKQQYVMSNGLRWDHCREFIFSAGNEYRKFETLDVGHTTLGLEDINWDGSRYHAWVWTDEPRPSYVYDEDANGAFYIRNSDNIDNNTASEYLLVHFRLKSPRLPGHVYLNGRWTNDRFLPEYEMHWNDSTQLYEGAVWLKQGYYSYQYLWQNADGKTAFVPSEGDFFQTENRYQALVYYRGNTDRADRLVGYAQLVLK
jgi:hypothetical protein